MTVFFEDSDYRSYLRLLREQTRRWGVEVWAYCLMPNHVHLMLCPRSSGALSRAVGETHRQYAARVNQARGWTGHLWQERFRSCAMDEVHTLRALRYVLFNPVRARLVGHPADWPYSSVAAHLGAPDPLVAAHRLEHYVEDWEALLATPGDADFDDCLRRHNRSGRPLLSAPPVEGHDTVQRIGYPQKK